MTTPDSQKVLVALSNDEAASGALAFENSIGGGSGAVMYVLKLAFPVVLVFQYLASLLYTLVHADGLVVNIRWNLCADGLSIGGDDAD